MENHRFFVFLKRSKYAVLLGLAGLVASLSVFIAPFTWAHTSVHEWTKGQVIKIDAERAKITLKHDAIKSINMEAMTMPFKVAQANMLQGLAVGDKVIFQVEQVDTGLVISALKAKP